MTIDDSQVYVKLPLHFLLDFSLNESLTLYYKEYQTLILNQLQYNGYGKEIEGFKIDKFRQIYDIYQEKYKIKKG
jgi:hypothetical protein